MDNTRDFYSLNSGSIPLRQTRDKCDLSSVGFIASDF